VHLHKTLLDTFAVKRNETTKKLILKEQNSIEIRGKVNRRYEQRNYVMLQILMSDKYQKMYRV